jgi:hypothetical protein
MSMGTQREGGNMRAAGMRAAVGSAMAALCAALLAVLVGCRFLLLGPVQSAPSGTFP